MIKTEQVYQTPLSGKSIGVVFGAFVPLHQGHLDLIMRAKKENDGGCIVIVCGYNGDRGDAYNLPFNLRYQYVREAFSHDPLINVYGINESVDIIPAYPDGWDKWLDLITQNILPLATANPASVHFQWYVGEADYNDKLIERGHDCILVDRKKNLISATMIRSDPIKYWSKITIPFRRDFTHKILVVGTASEGKTTLVQDVGRYFGAPYGEEWARGYMAKYCLTERTLRVSDFVAFLTGQLQNINGLIDSPANHGFIISDTDAMVTKMYAEYYSQDKQFSLTAEDYKKIILIADEYAKMTKWDKVFVLPPRGSFVDDHQRYMGHSELEHRKNLYSILTRDLENYGLNDKVSILDGSFYNNYLAVVNYIRNEVLHEQN